MAEPTFARAGENSLSWLNNFMVLLVFSGDSVDTTRSAGLTPSSSGSTFVFQRVKAAGTLRDPVKVVGSQAQSLSPTAADLRARIRARWPKVLEQARELENTIPDPVQYMTELLGNLPGDYTTWREILEEPYG